MDVDDARPQGQMHDDSTTGHEANNLRVRGLLVFAAGLIGVTVLVLAVLALVMREFSGEERRQLERLEVPRFAGDTGGFPAPRIQPDPAEELTSMKKEDLGRLAEYGWIDRRAGIAHIPVDRAITILAEKGLPAAAAEPAPASGDVSKKAPSVEGRAKPGLPAEKKP